MSEGGNIYWNFQARTLFVFHIYQLVWKMSLTTPSTGPINTEGRVQMGRQFTYGRCKPGIWSSKAVKLQEEASGIYTLKMKVTSGGLALGREKS